MFWILADVTVPGEYVSALQGDGHDVTYTQKIPELSPEATDDAIAEYAASEGIAILSTDLIVIPTADATGRNTFQQHGIGPALIVSLTWADRANSFSTDDTETSIDSDARLILA